MSSCLLCLPVSVDTVAWRNQNGLSDLPPPIYEPACWRWQFDWRLACIQIDSVNLYSWQAFLPSGKQRVAYIFSQPFWMPNSESFEVGPKDCHDRQFPYPVASSTSLISNSWPLLKFGILCQGKCHLSVNPMKAQKNSMTMCLVRIQTVCQSVVVIDHDELPGNWAGCAQESCEFRTWRSIRSVWIIECASNIVCFRPSLIIWMRMGIHKTYIHTLVIYHWPNSCGYWDQTMQEGRA